MLPNVLVLGAAKAGTTTVHEMLSGSSSIFMSSVKEPGFFSSDRRYADGVEHYENLHFRGSEGFRLRGESTPSYLYFDKCVDRVAAHLGPSEVKFIVVLRNPLERTISAYRYAVEKGQESLPFESAIRNEARVIADPSWIARGNALKAYVSGSLYSQQLAKWFEAFVPERFLILLTEDLRSGGLQARQAISAFLDVPDISARTGEVRANTASESRLPVLHSAWRGLLASEGPIGTRLESTLMKPRVQRAMLSARPLMRRPARDEVIIGEGLRRELAATLVEDLDQLEVMLGRDLDVWKRGSASDGSPRV